MPIRKTVEISSNATASDKLSEVYTTLSWIKTRETFRRALSLRATPNRGRNRAMKTDRDTLTILAGRFWVFDLDGTLTVPVHDFAVIRADLGVPDGVDILGYVASRPEEEGRLLVERLERIERELTARTAAAPGARKLVEALSRRDCRLGILTRNTREIAFLTLAHIGLAGFFASEDILGRNEARPKPEADGLHKLAGLWKVAPEELIMVGDYVHDLQAGQAAGAATIHVYGNRGRRWPEWTDLHFESLVELADGIPR